MPLPYSFILGLLCIFTIEDLNPSLPLDPDPSRLYPYFPLLILPWVLARLSWRPLSLARPAPRSRILGLVRRLPGLAVRVLAVPAVFWCLLGPGDLPNLVAPWTGGSNVVGFLYLLVPLVLLELSTDLGRFQAARAIRTRDLTRPPLRGILIAFISMPPLFLNLGLDLVGLSRRFEVFVHVTGVGLVLAMMVLLLAMALVLPPLLCWLLPTSREVPGDVVATAGLLGFPADKVLQLHSDSQIVNAGLIGPIPGLRYLILTDGLLHVLDPLSLRGVVAHEVGHARANHPMLLVTVVLVPMLFLHPLVALGVAELDEHLQLAIMALGLSAGLWLMRRLAHRFELEADQLSAEALGGAGPCILALLKVGELFGGATTKASFRHPSDEQRIDHLLRCDGDPWFRELFLRRGVCLRRWILALLIGAGLANAWAQSELWKVDRLAVYFYTGQFAAADTALAAVATEELSIGERQYLDKLRQELAAARSILPAGGAWRDIRQRLAAVGWRRGQAELLRHGAAAARPWLALALAQGNAPALRRSLYLYADAAVDLAADTEPVAGPASRLRLEALRRHLLDNFDLPVELAAAL